MFIEKHRKSINIGIVAFVCFLIVSLFTAGISDKATSVQVFDAKTIAESGKTGYETVMDENGCWEYKPTNDDPQIYLVTSGFRARKVVLNFAEEVSNINCIQIYYDAESAGGISEANSVLAHFGEDKKTVTTYLPLDSYNLLRLDINGSFKLESVELAMCEDILKLNILPLILLLVTLTLTVVFESKLQLYSSVKQFVVSEIETAKKLNGKKDKAGFILRQTSNISLVLLVLFVLTLITGVIASRGTVVAVFLLGLVAIVSNLVYRLAFAKEPNSAIIFLLIALVFGIVLSYCMPITTWNSWDEEIHYGRTVDLKNLFIAKQSSADVFQEERTYATLGVYLSDIKTYIDIISGQDLLSVQPEKANIDQSFIAYIPYAFIMILADILGTGYFAQIVLAKFFNVFVCSFVIYLGMRKLKSGKLIFAAVTFIPSVMFTMASFSYDVWIISFFAYGYASFISELQNPERTLTVKNTVLMLGSVFVGAFPKAVYLFMAIPLMFMPKSKFGSKKQRKMYILACVIIMIVLALMVLLPLLVNPGDATDDRGGTDVNSAEQLKFVFKNPLKYAKILLTFMGEYVAVKNMNEFVGSYYLLGKTGVFVSGIVVFLLFFTAIVDKKEGIDEFCDSPKLKLTTILTLFVQIAAMASALYVAFTPVAHGTVLGCQYRYMYPLLIPAMFFLGTPKLRCNVSPRTVNSFVFSVASFNLFVSFWDVYVSKLIF